MPIPTTSPRCTVSGSKGSSVSSTISNTVLSRCRRGKHDSQRGVITAVPNETSLGLIMDAHVGGSGEAHTFAEAREEPRGRAGGLLRGLADRDAAVGRDFPEWRRAAGSGLRRYRCRRRDRNRCRRCSH